MSGLDFDLDLNGTPTNIDQLSVNARMVLLALQIRCDIDSDSLRTLLNKNDAHLVCGFFIGPLLHKMMDTVISDAPVPMGLIRTVEAAHIEVHNKILDGFAEIMTSGFLAAFEKTQRGF